MSDLPSEASLTIDDLSARTGIPSRTIRFYQASGALPPPEKRGRVAYYGERHVERLELIGNLQDRGLQIRAIRDLALRIDRGELALDEWLGLEAQLQSRWVDDAPRVVDDAALAELLGKKRPGLVAELQRLGLLEPLEKNRYMLTSPALLQLALRLQAAGVDLETAADANKILSRNLGKTADELAKLFASRLDRADMTLPKVTKAVAELEPIAQEAVRVVFAREMERVLRTLVESGVVRQKRRRRRK
jgi:DNA-binding transcriptional MerR regulator